VDRRDGHPPRRALHGRKRAGVQLPGISGKVQSDVLEDLEEHGFVDRTVVSEKPFRVEYSLTDRGRSLEPVIVAMRDRGREHLTAPDDQ